MTSSKPTSSNKRAMQVLGRSLLPWPDSAEQSCCELTTHLTGRTSLRHFLSGLPKTENRFRETELLFINAIEVKGWSHTQVLTSLQQHLSLVEESELKLTLRGKDLEGQRHIVEVIVTVIYEDGFSLGDKCRAIYDVIVRTRDKIVTTPDVTDVEFRNCCDIRIRHGAMTGHFLRDGSDHTLCMDIPPSDSDDYIFKCYNFIGHNQEVDGGRGGGGGEEEFSRLCVLQQSRSGRFVAACPTSGCLETDEDEGFRTTIQSITKPDRHFFIIHSSGNGGTDNFCLRPLIMRNYFLRYDGVKGLRLKKSVPPPYEEFAVIRYFTFEFVTAPHKHPC